MSNRKYTTNQGEITVSSREELLREFNRKNPLAMSLGMRSYLEMADRYIAEHRRTP